MDPMIYTQPSTPGYGKAFTRYLLRAIGCGCLLLLSACKTTEVVATRASIPPAAPYQATPTKCHDLLHTQLDVRFDWERQELHGVATLTLQPHCYPQQSLVLDACSFAIHHVARMVQQQATPLAYVYDGKQLTIDLGAPLPAGTPYEVEIAYTARPQEVGQYRRLSPLSDQGLFFVQPDSSHPTRPRQIWTQGQPQSSSCWFPTIDAPNQRCTQALYITVAQDLQTLSNGVLAYSKLNADGTKTDCWHLDQPHAPYLFMLAVGQFAEVQDAWNDLEVNYYVEPEYAPYAQAIFGHTPEMLEFFSQKLNYPYPWPKYSQILVRHYKMGAMENTSAVVLSDELQVDGRYLIDQDYDDIIAHELFHHWFGNLVTCESWAHLSLNEAFACLGSHLWREHKYGQEDADLRIWQAWQGYLEEAKHKQVPLIRWQHARVDELFDKHSYNKGALVLHMLRQYVGEDAFFQALHRYLHQHAFATVEIHQLRKVFEEVTGEDLHWFFSQWFLTAGHPMLQVAHQYHDGQLTVQVWQQPSTATAPVYRLPLTWVVWTQGEPQHYEVVVDQPYQSFSWTLPEAPSLVYLDRRTLLLGVVAHPKSAEEYQYLYAHGEDFFAKWEALAHCSQHQGHQVCCQVLQEALQDEFWFFRKVAAEALKHYAGPDMAVIEATLMALCQQDEHPQVRAAALSTLGSFPDPAQYVSLYQQGLADASYRVMATALPLYAATSQAPDKLSQLAQLEACDHPHVVLALARYYTHTCQPQKYDWLQSKVTHWIDRAALLPLMQALGRYLGTVPDENARQAGLAWLRQLTSHTTRADVRRAACEALRHMGQGAAVQALLHELEAA